MPTTELLPDRMSTLESPSGRLICRRCVARRATNAISVGISGVAAGALFGGPGFIVGGAIGLLVGYAMRPAGE